MVFIAWNSLKFHLLEALPKGNTFNAEYYPVNILAGLLPLRPQIDGRRLIIHADKAIPRTTRKRRAFAKKIGSASPDTHRAHLISQHSTSFSSDISDIVYKESIFHHVKNHLQ
jgi:hypothetical protein